jgi:hypothetical protein
MPSNLAGWQRNVAIPGMLFFGTCTVVVQKFLFEQRAKGLPEYPNPHEFRKPWFQTNSMFLGMLLALAVHLVQKLMLRRQAQESILLQSGAGEDESQLATQTSGDGWKIYFISAAPSCCDLFGTALGNIGLLWIEPSVWQMLRGSMVLFSSIFCAFILKRAHFPYMWWSVLIIMIGEVIVGISSVFSTGAAKPGVSTGQVVIAILLTVFAQVIQATQIVVEDFFMHDLVVSPVFVVGLEGLWGSILTCAFFLPATYYIGGTEGSGIHEDTLDTFEMLKNNSTIILFVIIYVLVILCYNVTGMFVTAMFSAVVRTILEGVRTMCIWFVQVILHFAFLGSKYGNQNPDIGEELSMWSVMQFSGFALLFTGMLLYNRIIEVPWFEYPSTEARESTKAADESLASQPLLSDAYD